VHALLCFFGIYISQLLAHFAEDITTYPEIRQVLVITTCSGCCPVASMMINIFAQLVIKN